MKNRPIPIDGANLTLQELEMLAEGIRQILVGSRGLTIQDYMKRASTIDPSELGYIRIKAIGGEPKLEAYFPDDIFKILRERFANFNIEKLNDYDKEFFARNQEKGYEWLSQHMYTPVDVLKKILRHNKVAVSPPKHSYTPEQIEFIKNNASKGVAWLSKSLGLSKDSIRHKAKRIGIDLINPIQAKMFTQAEDQIIRDNADKGTRWLASQLGRSIDSVRKHAQLLNVKVEYIQEGHKRHKFTEEEDRFIRRNSHKGIMWLVNKMGLPYKSIFLRAHLKKIKIRRINRKYSNEDINFIRNNIDKGIEYLASQFNVSCRSIELKLNRMGIVVNEENRNHGRELQPPDQGTHTGSQVCSL